MKKTFVALGLAAGLIFNLCAEETLRLKLEPDRGVLLKGASQEVVIKIDLEAATHRKKLKRTPLNLAVVLDRSGSMTGAKLEKAKQAALQLVDQLSNDDVFSLVTYSDRATVNVSAQRVKDKARLRRSIEGITASGSTALHAGVKSGAAEMREYISDRRINRVILLSDGLANVGPSSTSDLRRLGRELAQDGIAVTTIGLGDDYNEDLMAGLAEASDANYYYVQDTEKLPEIFAKELGELLTIAARSVRIEIICPDGVKPLELIGRPEKFDGQRATVKLSHLTLGQNREVFLRCRVEGDEPEVAQIKVHYVDELQGGEHSAVAKARIGFTKDKDVAERSVNAALVAEKELLLTALRKDEALAAADAGNYREAAQTLRRQAAILDENYKAAPAAVQVQIRSESAKLRERSRQLEQGEYDSSTRKSMQSESFSKRNSK